jgi:hypothetical protein
MGLFGPSINKFQFVNFSKSTAKSNPDMILREYRHLIAEKNDEIREKTNSFGETALGMEYKIKEIAMGVHYKVQSEYSLGWGVVRKMYKQHEKDIESCHEIHKEIEAITEEMSLFIITYK